ncbi:glucose dehydrogenase [FAD, quinone]-like [Amblyomma americanum]
MHLDEHVHCCNELDAMDVGGRGASPQSALALVFALVNLVVHVPFTDLPVLEDYELGELRQEYDYVIVGGGSAGCVVANRLSAYPNVTVLLLEAGGLEEASNQIPITATYSLGGHDDWGYQTVPQKHACLSYQEQRCGMSRGKVLGGSSVLNFLLYTRGSIHDYDRWAREYGATGWAYGDVLPHFKAIEDYRAGQPDEYHGFGGEVPVDFANSSTPLSQLFLAACKESRYPLVDYNGRTQSGCSRVQANIRDGARVSASKAFIQPILRTRKNLHVALFSQVTKVNFEGSRAVGVTFFRYGESQKISARLEVILSAGAVGSAQILMLSGVGPREDLERLKIPVVADLPVGRSLQDHPLLLTAVPVSTATYVGIPPFTLSDIAKYASNRTGSVTIPVGAEALQFVSTDYTAVPVIPNVELVLISFQPANELARSQMLGGGLLPEAYDSYFGPGTDQPGFRVTAVNIRPKSRGSLKLRTGNAKDYPSIDPRLLAHPDDVKALAQGAKMFIDRMLNTQAMKKIGAEAWRVKFPPCAKAGPLWSLKYTECLFRHFAQPGLHLCCTAPMGSHQEAVVDERLRVRGNVTGLRVADASVMPDIVSGHTNAPAMMIGSKAASMIIEDSRH